MALLETLNDSFNGTTLDTTKWVYSGTTPGGGYTVGGGILTLTPSTASNAYAQIQTAASWVLATGSFTSAQIPRPNANAYAALRITDSTGNNWAEVGVNATGNAQLTVHSTASTTTNTMAANGWYRIRYASDGYIHFDYSSNGTTWTDRGAVALWPGNNTVVVTLSVINLVAGSTSPGTFDNVGVYAVTAVPTSIGDPETVAAPAVAYPSLASLTDDFNGTTLDTSKWTAAIAGTSTVTVGSGVLTLAFDSSASLRNAQISTTGGYVLAGSSIIANVVPSATSGANMLLNGNVNGDQIYMAYINGGLYGVVYSASTSTLITAAKLADYATGPYPWWRIRQSGTTVNFDLSTDGGTWTAFNSASTSTVTSTLYTVQLYNWNGNQGSTPSAASTTFDKVGIYPRNPDGIGDAETLGAPTLNLTGPPIPYGTDVYGGGTYGGNAPLSTAIAPAGIGDAETLGAPTLGAGALADVGYGSGLYGQGPYSGGTVTPTSVTPDSIDDGETLNGAASDSGTTATTNYTYGAGDYGAGLYGGPTTGTTNAGDYGTGAATTGYGSGLYGAGIYPGVTASDTPPDQTSIPLFANLTSAPKVPLHLLAIGPWSPQVEWRGATNYGIGKGKRPARPIMNLPISTSLSFTLRLKDGCEASASFNLPRGSAIIIEEMHTDLWWRRKDPYTGALEVMGRFNCGTNDLTSDGTAMTSSVHFVDYETLIGERLILKYRNSYKDDPKSPDTVTSQTSIWNKADPVTSVMRFIIPTDMGIDLTDLDDDTLLGALTQQFTIDPSSTVADVITNLLAVSPKPWEWWVEQSTDLTKAPKFRAVVGERGSNKGVTLFDFGTGPSPIASWSMQAATGTYANAIWYQGAYGGVVETIPSQIAAFGQRDTTFTNNSLKGSLAPIIAAAQKKLKVLADRRPTFSVVLRPGFWRGRQHIDIGDTVRIVIRLGTEVLDYTYRVSEIQVDVDTTGSETVTLTLGTTLVSSDPRSRRSLAFRLLRTMLSYTAPSDSSASTGTNDTSTA